MKNILILLTLLLFSCTEPKYKHIGQEIIDGKVSATQRGEHFSYGNNGIMPAIWVQNEKETKKVEIPFDYENRWHVGDSCLLIIEKYEIIKE
jgi:hypothetical protein